MVLILSGISATYSSDILQFNITKSLNWSWKNSDYLTGLKNTRTTWMHSIWFYDILDLDLKSGRTILLELDWFYDIYDLDCLKKRLDYLIGFRLILPYIEFGWIKWINQAEMQLEKYEDFLEFKQFVIQSSPVSLGYVMCGVWKTKYLCC